MKKIICLLLILCSLSVILACRKSSDYETTTYGSNDNLYIYRGNGKCSTSGDNYEKLVNSFTFESTEYTVKECIDYYIKNNDIYLILYCECDENTLNHPKYSDYFIVKYNVSFKSTTIISSGFSKDVTSQFETKTYYYIPHVILDTYSDCIAIDYLVQDNVYLFYATYNGGDREKLLIDFSGNVINQKIEQNDYSTLGNYLYRNTVTNFYLKDSYINNEESIFTLSNPLDSYEYKYYKDSEKEGIIFFTYRSYSVNNIYYNYLFSIKFYNINTKTMYNEIKKEIYYEIINNNYINTFNLETRTHSFFPLSGESNETVKNDNEIYKLKITSSDISLEKIHTFDNGKEITVYSVNNKEIIYNQLTYNLSLSCKGSSIKNIMYIYNLETKKATQTDKTKVEIEDEHMDTTGIENGYSIGDYVYYFVYFTVNQAIMSEGDILYSLKRYNKTTGNIDIMQQFISNISSRTEETNHFKYCSSLWADITKDYYSDEKSKNIYSFAIFTE